VQLSATKCKSDATQCNDGANNCTSVQSAATMWETMGSEKRQRTRRRRALAGQAGAVHSLRRERTAAWHLANSCVHTADWQSAIRQIANLRYEGGAIPERKCLIDNVCSPRNAGIMAQKAQKAQKCFQASRPFLEILVSCVSVLIAPNRANRERSMSLYLYIGGEN